MIKKVISLFFAAILMTVCVIGSAAAAAGSETGIVLSDSGIKVNGTAVSAEPSSAVYTGADIVYYESGRDSAYGEGTSADEHTANEARAHTVVTITKAGTYRVSGTLSAGQLAIGVAVRAAAIGSGMRVTAVAGIAARAVTINFGSQV